MKRILPILLLAVVVGGCASTELSTGDASSSAALHPQSPASEVQADVGTPATPPATPFGLSPHVVKFDSIAMLKPPLIMKDIYRNRTPGGRGRSRGKYGGSGRIEAAVMQSLRWLKKLRNEDGSWGGQDEPKPVATGIALLAFLAHGETPASYEFGEAVKGAISFLLSLQKNDGDFRDMDNTPTLQHAIVTFALCETYGLTRHPGIQPACGKAVEVIIAQQNDSGLWGMEYREGDDLEASVWQVRALRSALTAGLDEEDLKPVLRKAVDALKRTIPKDKAAKKTGPATLCLQCLGYFHDPVCAAGMDALDGLTMNWEKPEFENPIYHWHFITQAKFHHGDEAWKDWNRSFAPQLVKNQRIIPKAIEGTVKGRMRDVGYWTSPGKNERYGTVYATALCCLMLQNYYRYLPLFRAPVDVRQREHTRQDGAEIKIDVTP